MKKILLILMVMGVSLFGASKSEIDMKADLAMKKFTKSNPDTAKYLQEHAKGILIFPSVIKAGFGIGGEYGEGVLLSEGKDNIYYSTASVSIGFQFGAQQKSFIIAFLTDDAYNKFVNSNGWEVGVDGSVALIKVGVGKNFSTSQFNKPIVGFVFGSKGLMYNLTLEGTKLTKIVR